MKFHPSNLIQISLGCLALLSITSCNKDSDLLAEYVVENPKALLVNDLVVTLANNPITIEPLKNDTFKEPDKVTIVEVTPPSMGTAVINEDNTVTYTPDTDKTGTDQFDYATNVTNPDNTVTQETGSVTVTVTDKKPSPTEPSDMGELKAFPGAEGHGRYATGGRGGNVYQVTNLNDSGSGSLRDAISQGNRTIVFRVGGVIHLKSRLYFQGDNITIAGETAPGDGIAVYGSMTDTNSHENIIIRYMNFLVGDNGVVSDDDSFRLRNSGTGAKSNFIFDHCGFFWGKDENFAIEANNSETGSIENVTVQRSIIGEAFHERGFIIWRQGFNVSVINNLFSNNRQRNIRSSTRYASWEQINNVIYNYEVGVNPTWSNEFDIIGNVFLRKTGSIADINNELGGNTPLGIEINTKAYINDNTYEGKDIKSNVLSSIFKNSRQVSSGYIPLPNTGTAVLDNIIKDVGANINGNNPIANKQINDVINGTGSWISNESQTVALTLKGGTPYTDTDKDGISDEWEIANGLNPNDASDGRKDANGDGYTNLETFLHYLTLN